MWLHERRVPLAVTARRSEQRLLHYPPLGSQTRIAAQLLDSPHIAHAEPRGRIAPGAAQQPLDAVALVPGDVGPAGIELLVALDQIRAVAAQPFHEDLAHIAAQVQRDSADVRRARIRA